MIGRDLQRLESGLIKLVYSFKGNSVDEFALKTPFSDLPNDILCYRPTLRSAMKMRPNGAVFNMAFAGHVLLTEHVEKLERKTLYLNDKFADFDHNFRLPLVPANSPFFRMSISLIKTTLRDQGFDIETSNWEGYKKWEEAKLNDYK